MRKILDSLSTITWLCMDICWMYDFYYGAMLFMILTITGVFAHIKIGKQNINNNLSNIATLSWVLMNSTWMVSDYHPHPLIDFAKVWLSLIGVVTVIIIASKDIKNLRSIRKFDK